MKKISLVLVSLLFLSISFLYGCDNLKIYWLTRKAQEAHNEGKYKEAIEYYEELIELDPDNPANYWDLAIAYIDMDEKDKAVKLRDKMRKLGYDDYADRMDELFRSSEFTIQRGAKDKKIKQMEATGY